MDFKQNDFSLFDVLKYTETVNFILGASKSGKTSFLKKIVISQDSSQNIYLLDTSGLNVENGLAKLSNIKILDIDFELTEKCLRSLPANSILIIDDFQLQSKIDQWQRVINYSAHHFKLSIFLVVHSHVFTNGLQFALKNCCNLYITYSNNSKSFLRSLAGGKYLSFFNRHWKEGLAGFNICFINTYHSFIINFVDCLFFKSFDYKKSIEVLDMSDYNYDSSDIAAIKEKRFYISDKPFRNTEIVNEKSNQKNINLEEYFSDELSKVYSKTMFPRMFKLVRCLLKVQNVISEDELILKRVNVIDFLRFTQRVDTFSRNKKLSHSTSSSNSDEDVEKSALEGSSSLGYSYVKGEGLGKKEKKEKKEKRKAIER